MCETALAFAEENEPVERWSTAKRIGFRFAFCYLVIFCVDLVADTLVMCEFLARPARASFPTPFTAGLWSHLAPWVGKHLLHVMVRPNFNGTGRWTPAALGLLLLCWLAVFGWKFYAAEVARTAVKSDFYGVWVFDDMQEVDASRPLLTDRILESFSEGGSAAHRVETVDPGHP